MYEEEYSTRGTTAKIKVEGGRVNWACFYNGQNMAGSVTLDEDGQETGLARARKAVDAAVTAVDNPLPPQTEAAPEGQPVVITPGTGNEPLTTDVPKVDTSKNNRK